MSGFFNKAVVWLGLNEEYPDDSVVHDEVWESDMDESSSDRPTPQPNAEIQQRAAALQASKEGATDPLRPAPLGTERMSRRTVRAVPMAEVSTTSLLEAPSSTGPARGSGSGTVRAVPMAQSVRPEVVVPSSFNNAQDVADVYKDAKPVIVDLTAAERDLARRLIDFSAGLCYGLGGRMEKLSSDVYLLVPDSVEVSDADLNDWR